jgi:uncharacterized protein YjiS (DUF1127 family)
MTAPPIRLLVVALATAALGCDGRLERRTDSADAAARPAAAQSGADEAAEPEADASAGGFSSEAERTRAMEAQAADLKRQYDDAMANAATEEEKLRAYQEFEQGRQELDEMSDDDLGDGDDAYAPPPES